ncbi:MAG: carbohydrate ABC transporter permease [Tissierellia bacterium]|nr:carbohydrate ABC transporter permease [Tissierellia bacterium]
MNKKKPFYYYLGVVFLILFSLGPIIWCFIMSLTPEEQLLNSSLKFLPDQWILDNYRRILGFGMKEHQVVFNGLKNSFILAVFTLAMGVPIAVLTAYGLTRYDFFGKKILLRFLLLTTVIPIFSTIIPVYSIFRQWDLLDSMFWTSIIYISSFLPLNTWIIMNYMKDLPKELWQAAALDGMNEWWIFTKIILPLCQPIIRTVFLLMFIMAYKQYIIPMILLSSYDHKVLTMVMSEFMTRDGIHYGLIATTGIIGIIPPALGAVFFRKYLISGLTSGAVKG